MLRSLAHRAPVRPRDPVAARPPPVSPPFPPAVPPVGSRFCGAGCVGTGGGNGCAWRPQMRVAMSAARRRSSSSSRAPAPPRSSAAPPAALAPLLPDGSPRVAGTAEGGQGGAEPFVSSSSLSVVSARRRARDDDVGRVAAEAAILDAGGSARLRIVHKTHIASKRPIKSEPRK